MTATSAEIRALARQVRELRALVGDFLDEAEAAALGNYPSGCFMPGDPRQKVRHNKILAWYMRHHCDEHGRADLRRIKRARRALGLPAWWERP